MNKIIYILSLFLTSFTSLRAGERAYLHLDNSTYFLGDTLRLAAYVMDTDTKKLSDKSKVLYVELLAPEEYIVESRTYPLVNGHCAGDIYLRPLLLSGLFEVRAYTRYMQNEGKANYFSQVIPIYEQVEKGNYSKLALRKRAFRNIEYKKCKKHKGMECIDWTTYIPTKPSSPSSSSKISNITYHYDTALLKPFGLVTVKLKGQPGASLSLSITDSDNHAHISNKDIVNFINENNLLLTNATLIEGNKPEQGIMVYGKVGKITKTSEGKTSFDPMPNQLLTPILFFDNGYTAPEAHTDKTGFFSILLGNFEKDAFLQLKCKNVQDSTTLKYVVYDYMKPNIRKYTQQEIALQHSVTIGNQKVAIIQKNMGKSQFSVIHFDLIKEIDKLCNEDENTVKTALPSLLQGCGLLAEQFPCKSLRNVVALDLDGAYQGDNKNVKGSIVNNFTNIKNFKDVEIRSDQYIRKLLASPSSLTSTYQLGNSTGMRNVGYVSGISRYPSVVCCLSPDSNHEWDKYVRYNQIPNTRCLKITGFSPAIPYRLPNYSKSHPQEDYRRTLYWNPNLLLDENGEATIQFYNNGTCSQLFISGEGILEDGRAIICK